MSQVRVKISSDSIAETAVNALFDGEFTRKIERDRVYHTHEIKGNVVVYGGDYMLIKNLENDCEIITITIERFCSGTWEVYFEGRFTKFDCQFDYFRCTCSIKVDRNDVYRCIEREWDEYENVYENTGDAIVLREFYGGYEAGEYCDDCRGDLDLTPVCTKTDYCLEKTVAQQDEERCPGSPAGYYTVSYFHRITGTGTPTIPPAYGTGWTHLSGSTWWRCPDTTELNVGVLRYGRLFYNVLTLLASQVSCGLIVRSHFFGINATHAAPPANDAYTYATNYLQNMTVHQKSDVKRPDGDPAFSYVWKMKLKELLSDLQTMFNVDWMLDGTAMIIEHRSYFDAAAGADYTGKKIPLEIEYDVEAPNREDFYWADEDCRPLFRGSPIEYECGNEVKERRVGLFSTDVVFIRDEANQDKINDDKFVLISNKVDGGDYFINDQNAPLSWTNLHENLHRHYRPFISGTMNGTATTFESVQPIKKAKEFTVPFCCGDDLDPSKYVTTDLGVGRVQSQVENIIKDTAKIQLNYE